MAAILSQPQCVKRAHKQQQSINADGEMSFSEISQPVKLPWIFPGAPLNFNGAPGNIQGNLTGRDILYGNNLQLTLHTDSAT